MYNDDDLANYASDYSLQRAYLKIVDGARLRGSSHYYSNNTDQ